MIIEGSSMHVLVTGGRYYSDRNAVFGELDKLQAASTQKLVIIEGGQRWIKGTEIFGGADYWANEWARKHGCTCITVNADWDRHGNAAGPIRNSEMLKIWQPSVVLAFPGDRGTADMKQKASKAGVRIIEGGNHGKT
jgi:hypothetical protein